MHELGHIEMHLGKNNDSEFIDLYRKRIVKNDKEIETDNYTKEHLISASEWEDFIKNFAPYTDETSMIVESQKSMIKTCASSISYLRKQTILMR
jgi:tRNA A37 threonylcarbamoyladenosine biosynthesis protein TsaE